MNINWQEYNYPIDYEKMLSIMEATVEDVIKSQKNETVFLLEHNDIYTAGTSSLEEELIKPNKIPVIKSGRGGKYTYHGPGQRIIYPILNLASPPRAKDLKAYIFNLEEWMIQALLIIGIKAFRIDGKIGIWVKKDSVDAKIGAIGVRVRKWVTYHGISMNICPDLSKFNGIVPCGLHGVKSTSIQEMGFDIKLEEFDLIIKSIAHHFI